MSLKRKSDTDAKDEKQDKIHKKKSKLGGKKEETNEDGKKMMKDTAATRRERKRVRKMQKPNFEVSQQALKLWEKLRRNKNRISKEERAKLVDELMVLVKKMDKKLINLMYAHDTSRVVQSCLKQGNPEQRKEIYNELKDDIISLCKNRYSKNVVWKLLKFGTAEQRNEIIHQFDGQVLKLIKKEGPASVIEFAYNVYANLEQRNFLAQQLYGNSFNVSKSGRNSTLEDVLKEQPEKKEIILKDFKQRLVPLLDKQVIKHTIIHRVFNEFFTYCDDEQLRSELIEVLRESLIHIMHTRDGAHVAMQCMWYGTAKDRKVIIKTMKEFLSKLCQEEYGHLVLISAFDSVDDTVFIKKALILPIVKLIPDIIENKYAKKILLYLVSPRNASHFLPETIRFLSKGDDNKHSKKPMDIRHRELSQAVSPGITNYVSDHIRELACDKSLFVLVEVVINLCQGDMMPVINSLNEQLSIPFEAGAKDKKGKLHIIEDPAGHLLIKRLIMHGKENEDRVVYAKTIMESVSEENISSWAACNRGSQILLSLIQCGVDSISKAAKKMLKDNINVLKMHKDVKSTELLIEKLGK